MFMVGKKKACSETCCLDASEMFWFHKSSPLLLTCISASMQTGETLLERVMYIKKNQHVLV